MKTKIINRTLLILLLIFSISCKNHKAEEKALVDAIAEVEIPNISDAHFAMALADLKNNEKQKAAEELKKGKQGLIDESGNVTLTIKGKDQLDSAVFTLDEMTDALQQGTDIDENNLREAILKAELVIKHNYLVTEDIYMLATEKINEENKVRDVFNNNMEALNAFEHDLKADKKDTAVKLYKEGEQLKNEYDQWLEKVKVHNAKSSDFLESEIFSGNLPLR